MTASDPCDAPDAVARSPSRDLYCIELVPHPDAPGASGVAELGRAPSPFGVAATGDGRLIYDVTLALRDLPAAASLGPYRTYVAWATPPTLDPMVKLGEVGNGRSAAGRISFNRFLLFVSAEPSANVSERTGPLVLRGMSAGMQMSDTHLLGFGMGRAGGDAAGHAHGHEHGWTTPPMNPRVAPMPMVGLERAVPPVTPFLPGRTTDPTTLSPARPRTVVDLADGDTLELRAERVRRTIAGRTFVMYGFNGQYPGPLIRVDEDAEIVVLFENRIELPTAVHWHGIRIENRFDGVPGVTQEPVRPGGTFVYRVRFPDAGLYWYHPHHREDVQQDLGLYGNMLVDSPDPDYFRPANVEQVLMLDDLLIDDRGLFPFGTEASTHTLMGRFGNVFLVNGEPGYELEVDEGDVVRFFLTDVSNTRTFNLSFTRVDPTDRIRTPTRSRSRPSTGNGSGSGSGGSAAWNGNTAGVRMKIVGADIGKFEREEWVESIVIAPAQRYIVDVRFEEAGRYALVNRIQAIDHYLATFYTQTDTLGTVRVTEEASAHDHGESFGTLHRNADVTAEIDRYREHFDRPVDHELLLTMRTTGLPNMIVQIMSLDTLYFPPMEWNDVMPWMNYVSSGETVEWVLRDVDTGEENMDIHWTFEEGGVYKIRMHNTLEAFHPMQHPIHLHGQRFLVLSRDGVTNDNMVWKDTAVIPAGSTVDILLEASNPGDWMLHCHIAEHLEAGMKTVFTVTGPDGVAP